MLRPTASLVLHLQMIGRGMRPANGKHRVVVLDHAGNCVRHGLPEMPRCWTLDGAPKRKGGDPWLCPECRCLNTADADVCRACGADSPARRRAVAVAASVARQREIEIAAGELARLRATAAAKIRERIGPLAELATQGPRGYGLMLGRIHAASPALTDTELQALEVALGFRPGWWLHTKRKRDAGEFSPETWRARHAVMEARR